MGRRNGKEGSEREKGEEGQMKMRVGGAGHPLEGPPCDVFGIAPSIFLREAAPGCARSRNDGGSLGS